MKREKRLTKRERKAISPRPAAPQPQHKHDHHQHIHCTACGVHLEPTQFEASPPTAAWLRCEHGTEHASCVGCSDKTRALLVEHDRTGKPVAQASAWH